MIKEINLKLAEKKNLTQAEVEAAMKEIMSGQARPDEIAGFLMGLREKGETVDEITGAAKVMRENVIKIKPKSGKLLDTCGTGGDNPTHLTSQLFRHLSQQALELLLQNTATGLYQVNAAALIY